MKTRLFAFMFDITAALVAEIPENLGQQKLHILGCAGCGERVAHKIGIAYIECRAVQVG